MEVKASIESFHDTNRPVITSRPTVSFKRLSHGAVARWDCGLTHEEAAAEREYVLQQL